MREFQFFINNGDVKRQALDANTSSVLKRTSLERLIFATNILKNEKPRFVVENAFESIRERIDAILFEKGFKSFSHEASVTYLKNLHISDDLIGQVDMLRKMRNGSKYYGESFLKEDAVLSLDIARVVFEQLAY